MTDRLALNSRLTKSKFIQRRGYSVPLYVLFAVGFLIAGGGFVLQIGDTQTSQAASATASSILSQSILASLYLIATILLLSSGNARIVFERTWPVLVLPALAIASTFWSPDPALTFRRSIALLGTILFGLSLASRFSFVAGLRLIIQVLTVAMLLSVIWVIVFRTQGVHQATDSFPFQPEHAGLWRGIFAHKNILGGLSGFTSALILVYGGFAFNNKVIRCCALALTITCLVAARSGNGVVIAVGLPIMLLAFSSVGRLAPQLRLRVIVFLILLIVFFVTFWDEIFGAILWAIGKDPNLTGRTVLWNVLLQAINVDLPLYGYGYFAGFPLIVAPRINSLNGVGDAFVNAHNGYLEVLVAFGYIGMVIICLALVWLLWRAIRLVIFGDISKAHLNALPLSIVSLLIGLNMVESVLLSANSVWVILFSWCAAHIPGKNRIW